jgi:hypothetical protein
MRKRLTMLLVAAGAFAAVSAGVAVGEEFRAGNLILTVDGKVKPSKLPKKERAPIALQVEGHVQTVDGTTPPRLDRIEMSFDKQGKIDTKGLPKCSVNELENTLPDDALRKCKEALVGKGETRAIVDFPDQEPFDAIADPLLAFNGGPGKIIFHAYALVPTPTTFVVPSKISKASGKFGTKVTVNVPLIAGGNGRLVDFDVTIKRTWTHKGKKHSYVSAMCKTGQFVASGSFNWSDGTNIKGDITRPCKSKGG